MRLSLFTLLMLSASLIVEAKSSGKRTFSVCSRDADCSTPDIWSLMFCYSGSCQKTCKSGCKSSGSGCAPTGSIGSCPSGQGWNPVTKSCINVLSDPAHCGSFQTVCQTDNIGTATCTNGKCGLACPKTAYYNSASNTCVPNSVSACGSQGKACTVPISNGSAQCNNGQCSISCRSPYVYNAAVNDCQLQNTPTKCGSAGINCPVYAGTTATCTNGVCGVTCNNGGVYNPSTKSCTATSSRCGLFPFQQICPTVANGNSVCNGLTCQTVCNNGYVNSANSGLAGSIISTILGGSSSGCIPVSSNNKACGLFLSTCTTTQPGCISTCVSGSCQLSALPGFTFDASTGTCKSILNNPDSCGILGIDCYAPANATPQCIAGICSWTCNNGYTLLGLGCKANQASSVPNIKRAKVSRNNTPFCPAGEVACPIEGSQTLAHAQRESDGSLRFQSTRGGYECIDTTSEITSCGGCASTGSGKDCSKIPHALSMGCDNGSCVVFECATGYRLASSGDRCIKNSHHRHHAYRNATLDAGSMLMHRHVSGL